MISRSQHHHCPDWIDGGCGFCIRTIATWTCTVRSRLLNNSLHQKWCNSWKHKHHSLSKLTVASAALATAKVSQLRGNPELKSAAVTKTSQCSKPKSAFDSEWYQAPCQFTGEIGNRNCDGSLADDPQMLEEQSCGQTAAIYVSALGRSAARYSWKTTSAKKRKTKHRQHIRVWRITCVAVL